MCSQNPGCVCSMGDDQWMCVEGNEWEIGCVRKWLNEQKQTSTFWPLRIWKRTNDHLLEITWSLCPSVVSRAGQDVPGPVSCSQGGTVKESRSLVKIFYRSGITNTAWGPGICFHKKKKSCSNTETPNTFASVGAKSSKYEKTKIFATETFTEKKNLPIVALGQRQKGIKSKKIA